MNQTAIPTAVTEPAIAVATDALDRLTFLGWRGGLAAIVAGLAVSFLLLGYGVIYWRHADMDFMVIYSAFLLNNGQPQAYFDHPAYLTILSTEFWFRLLHAAGLLNAWSLASIPSASDAPAFDAAMTAAVRGGRVLAWLLATGCVLIFAGLVRFIVRDWRVALVATLAFAFSGGIAVHSRMLRSELLAGCPVVFALLVLMVAGRRATPARPLWLAVAAALCILGLENKVHAILLIGLLPLLVIPFGDRESRSTAFWQNTRSSWLVTGIAAGAVAITAWAAWPLIAVGFDRATLEAAQFRPLLLDTFGIYQAAMLALTGGCMIAYAAIWRVSASETLASMLAIGAGATMAMLALDLQYNAANVIAVVNPLEKMLIYDIDAAGVANARGLWSLLYGVGSVLARYTFVLHSSPRPTIFLTWLIIPGIVVAWRRGENRAAVQALMLLSAAILVDALGLRRGLKPEYFIFTDPLIILAGAILLDRMADLCVRKWAFATAGLLCALHIGVGHADVVKYAFKRSGPEPICQWNRDFLPELPLPWCALPPAKA